MWSRFKTLDPLLYILPIILMVISVVVIYTLTIDSIGSSLYIRQLVFSVLGVIAMVVFTFIDYRAFKSWMPWIYGLGLIGLTSVKLFGKNDFGAVRWIDVGPFQLQPAEI